jgi:gliding motility-associated lipoprotein GldB
MQSNIFLKMKRFFFFLFLTLIFIFSCTSERKVKEEVLAIEVDVKIDRFDEKFAKATPENLKQLKEDYPYFFPEHYHDSIWIQKTKDTLQKQLEEEVAKVFSDFSEYEDEITLLFQHLKYYFPEFQEPEVVTLISDVDYRNKVIYVDSLVVVGLDNFLGADHFFYMDIHRYIAKKMIPEQLTPEIAEAISERYITPPKSRSFMELMVYHGKKAYLKELLMPIYDKHRVFGYTEEELDWAKANEMEIWRYFVERELLFSTDPQLASRFINHAPFSKFYLELDNESPGSLGQYIGWQIVRAYAKNNDIDLKQLLTLSGEEIYKNSRFKPRR